MQTPRHVQLTNHVDCASVGVGDSSIGRDFQTLLFDLFADKNFENRIHFAELSQWDSCIVVNSNTAYEFWKQCVAEYLPKPLANGAWSIR